MRKRTPPSSLLPGERRAVLRRALADPDTRLYTAVDIGAWVRDLCLMFGSGIETAYAVSGTLAEGIVAIHRVADDKLTRLSSYLLGCRLACLCMA